MDLSQLKYKLSVKKNKKCENCRYLSRPYRKELNDTVYCEKTIKFIELKYSYLLWEK